MRVWIDRKRLMTVTRGRAARRGAERPGRSVNTRAAGLTRGLIEAQNKRPEAVLLWNWVKIRGFFCRRTSGGRVGRVERLGVRSGGGPSEGDGEGGGRGLEAKTNIAGKTVLFDVPRGKRPKRAKKTRGSSLKPKNFWQYLYSAARCVHTSDPSAAVTLINGRRIEPTRRENLGKRSGAYKRLRAPN